MESRAGTVQSDECPLLCALRVAGHGTGSARTGVDKSRRLTGQHSMSSAAHTAPARILCSYCAATVQLPSEGLFLCSCRRRGCSHKRVGAFCRVGIMGFEIWKQEGERVR